MKHSNDGAVRARASEPADPIAAATHPNPYPYYARLVCERPFYRDARLGLWVASSANVVTGILANASCHVRPPAEPVPRALEGSPAGEIFRRLVRMNDGENHCPLKRAVVATLDEIDTATLVDAARQRAGALSAIHAPHLDRAGLTRFMFSLPVQTMATLLGVVEQRLSDVTDWVEAFVASIGPLASAADVERGKSAATCLTASFRELLERQRREHSNALLCKLARQAADAGRPADDLIIANGIGLLSQTYEATAGLIGNTLLALARHASAVDGTRQLANLIQHVLVADPPTQSTRRFVTRTTAIAGATLQPGDAILVMLAAAGRDPAFNPNLDHLDLQRTPRPTLDFGSGAHACPAHTLAPKIAEQAVAHLLDAGISLRSLDQELTYQRSNHLRVPVF